MGVPGEANKILENFEGGNQKWPIPRNWQQRVHRTKKNKTKTQHYTQTNTNNVNKTWALLQTTGGKDESNKVTQKYFVRTELYIYV